MFYIQVFETMFYIQVFIIKISKEKMHWNKNVFFWRLLIYNWIKDCQSEHLQE